MATVCLLVLLGIPGAGKSTWARSFIKYARTTENNRSTENQAKNAGSGETRAIHVAFDDLIPEELEAELINLSKETKGTPWKNYRRAIASCVDQLIERLVGSGKLPAENVCGDKTAFAADVTLPRTGCVTNTVSVENSLIGDSLCSNFCDAEMPIVSDQQRDLAQTVVTKEETIGDILTRKASIQESLKQYQASADTETPISTHSLTAEVSSESESQLIVDENLQKAFDKLVGNSLLKEDLDSRRWIIVIDDNMYYASMRYEYYQIARKYEMGFAQVYFPVDLNVALERNTNRKSQRVSESTIVDMYGKLERPCAANFWERYSASWSNSIEDDGSFKEIFSLIDKALLDPAKSVHEDKQASEESRIICSTSLLHQADVALRKILGSHLAATNKKPDVARSKEARFRLAAACNSVRLQILADLRNQTLLVPLSLADHVSDASTNAENAFHVFLTDIFTERLNQL